MTFLLLSLTALAATPLAGDLDAVGVTENGSPAWAEAASAPAAAPAPIRAEDIQDLDTYAKDWIKPEHDALVAFLDARFGGLAQPNRDHAMVWLLDAQASCDAALARLAEAPSYQDDRSLIHVLELGWMDARRLIDEQAIELVALGFAQEVRGDDLARVRALVGTMDDRSYDIQTYVHASLLSFAEAHGGAVKPAFPPGRALTRVGPEVERSFAVRYHNMVVRAQRDLVQALNGFLQTPWMDPDSVEQARQLALVQVRAQLAQVRAMDAWAEDPAFRDATLALGEALEAQLVGGYAELPATFARETLSEAEEAHFEQLLADGARVMTESLAAFSEAQDTFRARYVDAPAF
ncbi:MAG: hypothetical protein H6741_01275 [Alphaproteobacteria bacterium]|nr:hypothetical protein [Alphaproteobacteria bacterium]